MQIGNLQGATVITIIGYLTDGHLVSLVCLQELYSATSKVIFKLQEFCAAGWCSNRQSIACSTNKGLFELAPNGGFRFVCYRFKVQTVPSAFVFRFV